MLDARAWRSRQGQPPISASPALRYRLGNDGRAMTDIDPSADIELTGANEHVTARIPLAGQVTGEWLGCYHRLARAAAVPVRAETQPDRAWLVVTVPAASNHVAEAVFVTVRLVTDLPLLAAGRRRSRGTHLESSGIPAPGVSRAPQPGRCPAGLASGVRRLPLPRLHERHRAQPDGRDATRPLEQAGHDHQAIGSLAVLGLVVARAVNIFK